MPIPAASKGGYRVVAPIVGGIGITPYAAGQFTTFALPAYAEQVIVGANNFALAYGARSATDPRSELGLRSDKSFATVDGVLILRGRAAWAHDYDPNRSIAATFQACRELRSWSMAPRPQTPHSRPGSFGALSFLTVPAGPVPGPSR